ncbi:MAG TPA: RHS repeat-associated core domain-containing protein, partial [Pyrinomonadaceae bacterium]
YAQTTGPRQKYAGMEQDEATGMSHTLWREFDSLSARWTAPDPYGGSISVADPQSFNRYSYVGNDPVNLTDPTGLMAGAEQGISGFGGFGGGPGFLDPHFGGQGIIAARVAEFNAQLAERQQTQSIEEKTKASFIAGMQASGSKRFENYFDPFTQTPYEQRLAATFGGEGAVMRTRFDYTGIYRGLDADAVARAIAFVARNGRPQEYDPVWDSEHLANSPHLSGNMAGTQNTDILVPGNYEGQPTPPTVGANVVLIYYPVLGKQKNVTLAIFHVANFNPQRVGTRVRIGTTGGKGGDETVFRPGRPNKHAHFEVWRGRHAAVLADGPRRDAVRIPFYRVFK